MCIFLNFFLLLFIISIILYRPRQLYFRNSVSCHCPVKIEFKKTSFAKEGNKLPIHRRKPIENGFQILTPPPPYCWFGSVQVLESPQESSWRLKTFFRSVFMAKKEKKKKKSSIYSFIFLYSLKKRIFSSPSIPCGYRRVQEGGFHHPPAWQNIKLFYFFFVQLLFSFICQFLYFFFLLLFLFFIFL